MNSAALLVILGQQAAEPLPFPLDVMRGAAYQVAVQPSALLAGDLEPFQNTIYFVAPDKSGATIHASWTKNVGQKRYLPIALGSPEGEK